jgi:ABC-type Mn2+/Zn2+ transport system permease subunit
MAALLVSTNMRATFITAAGLGATLPCLGLAVSFYFDLPAGPASVALLSISVLGAAAVGFSHKGRADLEADVEVAFVGVTPCVTGGASSRAA